MKREEKKEMMRRKIIESAIREFSNKGYEGCSVNEVCAKEDISKGIIYHYFASKEELYLTCVRETFEKLTEFIDSNMSEGTEDAEKDLNKYFSLRAQFFMRNPEYQHIFCEAVITPPQSLSAEIKGCKASFDMLNMRILMRLLSKVSLRKDISIDAVVEVFCQLQDIFNARYQTGTSDSSAFVSREEDCRRLLDILLYGVIERKAGNV